MPHKTTFIMISQDDESRVAFFVAIFATVLLTAIAILYMQTPEPLVLIRGVLVKYGTWLYESVMCGSVVAAITIAVSPYGHRRLGGAAATPQYSTFAWLSMLSTAGMGIGLLMYGVSEPVLHAADSTGPAFERSDTAIAITVFHWGVHPWGLYVMVALAFAQYANVREQPVPFCMLLKPLFGAKISVLFGTSTHVIATLAIMFGVATSLGMAAIQLQEGLSITFGLVSSPLLAQVAIVAIVLISLVVLRKKLIELRWVSLLALCASLALLCFVAVAGPGRDQLSALGTCAVAYGVVLWERSFALFGPATEHTQQWLGKWTLFYWAWWVSWSPFVGAFIARISHGRTIRQLVAGVLVFPSAAALVWITIMGKAALATTITGEPSAGSVLFSVLAPLPLQWLTTGLCVFTLLAFSVVSSSTAATSLATLSPISKKRSSSTNSSLWLLLLGTVAVTLVTLGGAALLQTAVVVSSLPLCTFWVFASIGASIRWYRRVIRDTRPHGVT